MTLVSCGMGGGTSGTKSSKEMASSSGNPEAEETVDALVIPPDMLDTGHPPEHTDQPSNALDNLKGIKGVNVDELFSQNLVDQNQRFERLENAVLDLRREFEDVKPAIIRLVAIEEDIQDLIVMLSNELDIPRDPPAFEDKLIEEDAPSSAPADIEPVEEAALDQEENKIHEKQTPQEDIINPERDSAPIQNQPTGTTPPTMTSADHTAPPKTSAHGTRALFTGIRLGRHAGFTRIVLDGTHPAAYGATIDQEKQTLTLSVPNAQWNGAPRKTYRNDPLILSYTAGLKPNTQDVEITFALKQAVIITNQEELTKSTAPLFRIVIDLVAAQ